MNQEEREMQERQEHEEWLHQMEIEEERRIVEMEYAMYEEELEKAGSKMPSKARWSSWLW